LWHMPEGSEENQIKVANVPAGIRTVFYWKQARAPPFYWTCRPFSVLLHEYINTFWREKLTVIQTIGKVCRAIRVEMRLQQSLKKINPHSAELMNSQNGLLHP
jgi:hypothetical protein